MSIAVGQTAPDFMLLNQEKKEVKLSDFAGFSDAIVAHFPVLTPILLLTRMQRSPSSREKSNQNRLGRLQ